VPFELVNILQMPYGATPEDEATLCDELEKVRMKGLQTMLDVC